MPDGPAEIDGARAGRGAANGTDGATDDGTAHGADAGHGSDHRAGAGANQPAGDGTIALALAAARKHQAVAGEKQQCCGNA